MPLLAGDGDIQDPDESFGAESFEFTSGTADDLKSSTALDAPIPMPPAYLAMLRSIAAGVSDEPDPRCSEEAVQVGWLLGEHRDGRAICLAWGTMMGPVVAVVCLLSPGLTRPGFWTLWRSVDGSGRPQIQPFASFLSFSSRRWAMTCFRHQR